MTEHETVTKADVDVKITTHKDDASAHHTKTVDASELTAGILALARLANISNAQIAAAAAIAESKLSLDKGTQALFDKIAADIATHAGLDTGVHGVGASTVCSETEAKGFVTKELFVPVFGGTDVGYKGASIDGAGDEAFMAILVPQDFTSITNIEVIFLPKQTGDDMHFIITTYYSAYNGGEEYNVHTESESARDIGATLIIQYKAHSISDLVDIAPLAAGDLLLVKVKYNSTAVDSNAYVVGVRLKYA